MTSAQSILNEIADYIENHGWIQGESLNQEGACCLSYAIFKVTQGSSISPGQVRHHISNIVWAKIKIHHPKACGVVDFNDNAKTTKEDVLNVLRS